MKVVILAGGFGTRIIPFYAVRFGKLPYLENIFFFNHDKNV